MIEEVKKQGAQPTWRFLAQLQGMDLKVWSEEGRLRVSAPPGVLTPELREQLAGRKAEILDFLSEMRAANGQSAPLLQPIPRNRPLELSFAQQRLWMLDQIAPGRSPYHTGFLVRFEGALSVAALRSAIAGLVRRHEALRTSFPTIDGRPVQEIAPFFEPDVRIVDLGKMDTFEGREAEALRQAREEGQRPYDLAKGPLVRWRLYRLDGNLQILWAGMHHIITDGWSLAVIYRELAELYDAAVTRRSSSLEDLPIQYADFAAWQRNWLSGDVLQKQLDYWRPQLAGVSMLELPADRPVAAEPSFRGMSERISLSSDVLVAIKRLTSDEGATLFMMLLAGLQALLQRYTGEDDIVVGSPIANRNRIEIEGVVGFFVNSLVLRTDLSGNPTFREALRRVREVTLKAYEFQDMPFEKLVEELTPERNLGQNPFFQIMLALQNLPLRIPLEVQDLKMSLMGSKALTSRFEIEIHLWESSDGLEGQLVYNPDRFDASRIARMVEHYLRILRAVSVEPDLRLSDLPLLTVEEREQLLVEWNQTTTEYPREQRLHEIFDQQAQGQPHAIAVVCGAESTSYGELKKRADQLAGYLQVRGVSVGTRVGICMERSPEMICGILGILKAGAVYVPLDPSYPKERLNFMIKDADAPVVVTVEPFNEVIAESGAEVICLNRDWPLMERQSNESAVSSVRAAADLAYVIYTSGSTGTPKGVAVPHRAVVRLVLNSNYVDLGPEDHIAHLSNVCFDAATFEIWGALLTGACLVVISKAVALEPALFVAEIKRQRVSTLFMTTALFNELAVSDGRIFEGVKQVLFGGETVNAQRVRHVLESGGAPQRLLHVYGPTECTTFATFYSVTNVPEWAVTIPIGRPIANTTAYVLDRHRNPAPVGVPGELYLGGPGLAQGYLNQSQLTAEKFVVDPFSDEGRLYRTGDIVKYLPDGNIEFIGRADGQVKIRGFRIEPGEVESVLNRHPEVEKALVAREDPPGDRQLVAYLVLRAGGRTADWRAFLQKKLPSYFIPSAFVELDALPMTASGKLDRLALPKPRHHLRDDSDRAELTPTEEIVRSVWAKLLHADDLGVQRSFFELGGHSLLAIQVTMALREIVHIEIPVTSLFEHPTVSGLSRHIDELVAQDLATVRPPIEKVSRDQQLPLSFAQERLWRNERNAANSANLNVMVFALTGDLNISCLERSLQELVRRHEVLRTTFHLVGDSPVQQIAPEPFFKLKFVDFRQTPDAEAETLRLSLKEKAESLDLEHGPLMRASVFRLGRHHHRLVLTLHHMLYDIWSLPIFFRELDALYAAFCLGEDSPLPDLTVQQADFAVWQRKYLDRNSSTFQAQLAYWLKELSGNPVLRLPCERRNELKTASMDDVLAPFEISEETSANIRRLSRQEGTTLFITFLAALKALINLSTGQNDIMVGAFMANRSTPESDRMMGYFCDIGMLRTRVSRDLSFLELLCRVRETVINAHAHEDMPFDVLGEEMQKRGQGPSALRAIFMVETVSEIPFRLGDLEVNYLPAETRNAMPWRFAMRVRDGGGAFSGRAKFNARLHDPCLVRRMMWNYVRLLEAVVRKPGTRLCEVEGELRNL